MRQGAATVATYGYDAQGRRKIKAVGASTTVYVTDADNREVLEYDGSSGAVLRWHVFGQGVDDVLNQVNLAGSRLTMIPDIQGSVIATLGSGAGALMKAGYLAFGENPSMVSGCRGRSYSCHQPRREKTSLSGRCNGGACGRSGARAQR